MSAAWRSIQTAGHSVATGRWLLLLSLLVCCLSLPGCGGCNRAKKLEGQADAEKRAEELRKKKEQEEKPDFQFRQLSTIPHPIDRIERGIKPGHWASGVLDAIANHYDYRGQLAIEPFDLDDMPFRMGTTRRVVLPKAQRRELDLIFFPPVDVNPRSLGADLQTPRGGVVYREQFPLTRLPAHQYYLVVLARTPEQYSFLRDVDTVQAPRAGLSLPGTQAHYRPLMPVVTRYVPWPASLATSTSIACVVWDDLDPQLLNEDQQAAFIDWLHWGGQLVISGPNTLGLLKGSFLDPYLPAESSGTVELTTDDLAELRDGWSDPELPLRVRRPWAAEKLVLRPQARAIVSADEVPLVVDLPVGRGRVALTAFALPQRDLIAWSGLDNFLNGCLLLRPARVFDFVEAEIVMGWQDRALISTPERVTQMRFFARDSSMVASQRADVRGRSLVRPEQRAGEPLAPTQEDLANIDFEGWIENVNYEPGAAGWNDFSGLAIGARRALRDAAGIKIPSPSFVVGALSIYLLVLVPLNWGLFRAVNRVEWAWLAAPVISLVGAIVVVRAAQLDIGFARASNELAVIEMQPEYPRAHVARFVALYTSLSTAYDVEFDDFGAVAMPFADGTGLLRGQSRTTVTFRRDDKPVLEDFRVASNSIGMVHAEHMLPLDGQFELEESADGLILHNRTGWQLHDARLVHDDARSVLGTLEPGTSQPVTFSDEQRLAAEWERFEPVEAGEVDTRHVIEVAVQDAAPGEWRLVGWIAEPVQGMTVEPAAAQSRQRAVVVAHLRYSELPAPARDATMRSEIERRHGVPARRYREQDQEK